MRSRLKLLTGQSLLSPSGDIARPTTSKVREALFNIIREDLPSAHWLDLFSGSGIISCEAINNGARRVLSVEKNDGIYQICKKNISRVSKLNTEKKLFYKVIKNDSKKILERGCLKMSLDFQKSFSDIDFRFNLVYLDPPYKFNNIEKILKNLVKGNWLRKKSTIIYETSSKTQLVVPSNWNLYKIKKYGNTFLYFLTPNQA